jgi:hypothetical protein
VDGTAGVVYDGALPVLAPADGGDLAVVASWLGVADGDDVGAALARRQDRES